MTSQLVRHDAPPVDDPLTELQNLAGRALAFERAVGELVNDLPDLCHRSAKGEHLRAEVAVFERAMDRCGRLLVDLARLNIDERLVRITEEQANLITRAVIDSLAELGLSQDLQHQGHRAVARHLRAIEGPK